MDHARPTSRSRSIGKGVLVGTPVVLLGVAGVALARIDFRTHRVDRDKLAIEAVHRGKLEIKTDADGQLLPRHVEHVIAQVTARVARTHVRAGDVVTPGELLVELTNPELVASAEEAFSAWEGAVAESRALEAELHNGVLTQEMAVTQARFSRQRAELQLEVAQRLRGEHAISDVDFRRDELEADQHQRTSALEESRLRILRASVSVQLAAKKARITQLARALDRARNQVANLRVVAGIGGIVQAMGIDVGQQLQPGTLIGRIADQDQLYAELRVRAREAADLRAGQRVIVDTRSGTAGGVVTRVDPAVSQGTVTVDVDLRGILPAAVRPQLPVDAVIFLTELPDVLYVGKPAYARADGEMAVYKLDPSGRYATRVSIRSGKVSLSQLQVVDGLREGDQIITSETGEWQDQERILLN